MTRRAKLIHFFCIGSLLLLCVFAYSPSLFIGPIMDDTFQLAWAKAVADGRVPLVDLVKPFPRDPYEKAKRYIYFRPLHWLIFIAIWFSFGLNFFVMHVLTLAAHILVVLLLYLLVWMLTRNILCSLTAGLLFGINLGLSENVCWISCITTIISTCFHLGAIVFYILSLRTGKRVHYIFALMLFVLSLLTNETSSMTIGLLMVIAYLELMKECSFDSKGLFAILVRTTWTVLRGLSPFIILTVIYSISQMVHVHELFPGFPGLGKKLLASCGFMVKMFIGYWSPYEPGSLEDVFISPYHTADVKLLYVFGLAMILLPFVSGIVLKNRAAFFGFSGFIIMVVPFIFLWPFNPRYMYGPSLYLSVGFAALLFNSGVQSPRSFPLLRNKVLVVILLVVFSFVWAAWNVPAIWQHTEALALLGKDNLVVLEQLQGQSDLEEFNVVILHKPHGKKKKIRDIPPRYLGYLVSKRVDVRWYDYSHPYRQADRRAGDTILRLRFVDGKIHRE